MSDYLDSVVSSARFLLCYLSVKVNLRSNNINIGLPTSYQVMRNKTHLYKTLEFPHPFLDMKALF